LEFLGDAGARAIGLDIYRDIPVPPGTERLDAAFTANPRVIVPSKFADDRTGGVAPPAVLAGTDQVGFNDMVTDPDAIVRRGLLFMEDGKGGVGYSLPLQLALRYLADEGVYPTADPEDPALMRLGQATFAPLTETDGGYARADVGGYQYLMDYRGAPRAFPTVTLSEVLDGAADPSIFHGRIAMIGTTAESTPDRLNIAFERRADEGAEIAGAALHGYMASQLVRYALGDSAPIRTLSDAEEALLLLLWVLIGTATGLWVRATWRFATTGAAALAALWLIGWATLHAGWWIPVVPPALGWLASASFVTAYLSSRERAERAELMQLFSRHVTKQVAEDVWRRRDEFMEGGRPKPERVTATILFVDIKGYTTVAEKMEPQELMSWIDAYLSVMAQKILDHGGLVDDYFGDGIMACFGIPIPREDAEGIREDACNAVLCALDMENTLTGVNAEWNARGLPSVGIRVGICTGPVVAGSIGSENRLKYGAVGDVVVTAQRIESLDHSQHDFEAQPCRILISERTRDCVDGVARTEEFGDFLLKGKKEPVTIYRVCERVDREAPPEPQT
jgi:adenylate cyclase